LHGANEFAAKHTFAESLVRNGIQAEFNETEGHAHHCLSRGHYKNGIIQNPDLLSNNPPPLLVCLSVLVAACISPRWIYGLRHQGARHTHKHTHWCKLSGISIFLNKNYHSFLVPATLFRFCLCLFNETLLFLKKKNMRKTKYMLRLAHDVYRCTYY
jgi:hypothetical protein